jgi:hypothetical protein
MQTVNKLERRWINGQYEGGKMPTVLGETRVNLRKRSRKKQYSGEEQNGSGFIASLLQPTQPTIPDSHIGDSRM